MTFAHPAFLWGMAGALIPLLVHLFDRRRAKKVPFGAIAFVLRSQKRDASRLKLKRLILYILRTLVLLALPLALARPQLSSAAAATAAEGPQATAVVLDASRSLGYRDGDVDFEVAKADARAAVSGLRAEEPVTVVVCDGRPPQAAAPGFDHRAALQLFDDAQASLLHADLNACLDAAARALAESPLPGKRLVVASDFAAHGIRLDAPAPTVLGPKGETLKPQVVLRDASRKHGARSNRALAAFTAEPATQVGPHAWAFTFTVKNASAEAARDVELKLEVDGRVVAKGFVDVAANGTSQKTLSYRFEKGGLVTVKGQLAADGLESDDARTLALAVPKVPKVLIVNGAPSPQKYSDEAFFVESALQGASAPVESRTFDTDAAWREDFATYDVVFLLNVEAPPAAVASRLEAFVTQGGGLFISLGDRVDPDAWNAAMGTLLPRPLRVVKTAVEPTAPDAAARAARLVQVKNEHPVLAPFTGAAREGLLAARFFRYALLEARGTAGAEEPEVLASLDDGAPLLAALRHGQGRVLLDTSTVDRDGTDFPVRTAFLPVITRSALWLGGALEERVRLETNVGDRLSLPVDARRPLASVSSPSGASVPLSPQADGTVLAGPFTETGAHLAKNAKGEVLPTLAVSVGVELSESELARVGDESLTQWFGEDSVQQVDAVSGERRQTPVWTWLILAAALAFIGEGLLLAPTRRRRAAPLATAPSPPAGR